MTEESKIDKDNHKPDNNEPQKIPQDIILTIKLSQETGQLSVQGPGDGRMFDEPICFWLLIKAQRFIERTNAIANQPNIIKPKGSIVDFARRFKR